ncbi:MAG: hypothetical protein ACLQLC_00735 [Candidatus Sulfotelmatobacter sp.]
MGRSVSAILHLFAIEKQGLSSLAEKNLGNNQGGNASFAFGGFTHDSEGILAAVYRFADVILEGGLNCFPRIRLELGIAAFTNTDHHGSRFHDSQFSPRHKYSLAPIACGNETAPVPGNWQP